MKQLFSWVGELLGPRKNVDYFLETAAKQADDGNHDEAEKLYRRALEMAEEAKDHESVASAAYGLARVCEAQDKFAVADTYYRQAYQSWEDSEEHERTAQCLVSLGKLYIKQRRLSDAENVFHYAVRIYQQQHGNEAVSVAEVCSLLADCCLQERSYREAQNLLNRAVQIYEKSYDSNHPVLAENLYNLARSYYLENDHETAERLFQRALDIFDSDSNDNFTKYAHVVCSCCHEFGRSLQQRGKKEQALALLKRARDIADQFPGYLNEAELVDEYKILAAS